MGTAPGRRERALLAIQRWAARQIERRLHAEWDAYQQAPEIRTGLFRRSRAAGGAQVSRNFIQINFLKGGRSG